MTAGTCLPSLTSKIPPLEVQRPDTGSLLDGQSLSEQRMTAAGGWGCRAVQVAGRCVPGSGRVGGVRAASLAAGQGGAADARQRGGPAGGCGRRAVSGHVPRPPGGAPTTPPLPRHRLGPPRHVPLCCPSKQAQRSSVEWGAGTSSSHRALCSGYLRAADCSWIQLQELSRYAVQLTCSAGCDNALWVTTGAGCRS